MKFAKDLYLVILAIVVCYAMIALWGALGLTGGSRNFVVIVACCAVIVGSSMAAWSIFKQNQAIDIVIKQLQSKRESVPLWGSGLMHNLSRAINERFHNRNDDVNMLYKQLKTMQIQLQLSKRQKTSIESIIYSIHDGVVVIDEADKVMMANEAAGAMLGFDYQQVTHCPVAELVTVNGDKFVDFLCQSRKSKVKGARKELDFVVNESTRTYNCTISLIANPNNENDCGAVAVLHDITHEKEISQMKSDFVSHVSHELKTPLASITAYSEMLLDGEANDEKMMKHFCTVIQTQAVRLNRLIEDILNVSRIESGLVKIEKELVSVTVLIEEQMQMIKGYAEEKNIKVVYPKPIVFDQVYADKDMLSQVIVNLLSNAVKYTPNGGTITTESLVDETNRIVAVSIKDTGVGIPPEDIEHIFGKFYRVEANKQQAKGTGLGLNLVKKIVEKVHGGKVFVTSKVGEGSTFGFELPMANRQTAKMV